MSTTPETQDLRKRLGVKGRIGAPDALKQLDARSIILSRKSKKPVSVSPAAAKQQLKDARELIVRSRPEQQGVERTDASAPIAPLFLPQKTVVNEHFRITRPMMNDQPVRKPSPITAPGQHATTSGGQARRQQYQPQQIPTIIRSSQMQPHHSGMDVNEYYRQMQLIEQEMLENELIQKELLRQQEARQQDLLRQQEARQQELLRQQDFRRKELRQRELQLQQERQQELLQKGLRQQELFRQQHQKQQQQLQLQQQQRQLQIEQQQQRRQLQQQQHQQQQQQQLLLQQQQQQQRPISTGLTSASKKSAQASSLKFTINNRQASASSPGNNGNEMDTGSAQAVSKVSPIQGFRIELKNLHPSVTTDDIYELFSCVGPLRLCNLIRPGYGEVVYNRQLDALAALHRYNDRELDGRPMRLTIVTPIDEMGDQASGFGSGATKTEPRASARQSTSGLFMHGGSSILGRGSSSTSRPIDVEPDVIKKALFNVTVSGSKPSGVRRPVNFAVNI